jgi:hypothetical protein
VIAVSTTVILNMANLVVTLRYLDVPTMPVPYGILVLPTVALENAMACRVFRHLKSVMQTQSSGLVNGTKPPLIPLANRVGFSTSSILHPTRVTLAPRSGVPVDVAVDSDAKSSRDVLNVAFPPSAKLSPMRAV